jgi:xanthine/uracil permease
VVGTALFVALLLMSFGIRLPVVLACLLALVADGLLLLRADSPDQIQTITAAALLVVLLGYALATLRRAQLHH